jgi:filamentous hemagglutinin
MARVERVYNFTVDEAHTYFVGDGQWLVHNTALSCGSFLSLDDFANAAAKPDKGLLTGAGRAAQKHGSRPGSAFPPTSGSPANINAVGQDIAVEILTNPGTTFVQRHHTKFGTIIEFYAPDGRGVRFDANGKFIGFLEP